MRFIKWRFSILSGVVTLISPTTIGVLLAALCCMAPRRWGVMVTFLYLQTGFYLPGWLIPHWQGKTVRLCGEVVTVPMVETHRSHWLFRVRQWQEQRLTTWVTMTDYRPKSDYRVGDRLVVMAKVHGLRNLSNPGMRHYAQQQYANGIYARVSVVRVLSQNHAQPSLLFRLRQRLSQHMMTAGFYPEVTHFLQRLMLGQRTDLGELAQAFRRTGTSHLMAISGLHVGMMSGLSYGLSWQCCRWWTGLTLRFPAQQLAAVVALITAWGYGALAGMAVSTQRACIMVSLWLSVWVCRRQINPWQRYLWALCLVCWCNPWVVFTLGFYLSFYVVFLLIWFYQPGWWGQLRQQWQLWWLLLPLNLSYFHWVSVSSLCANMIAIPLLSVVILPLSFLWLAVVLILPQAAAPLGSALQAVILLLFRLLQWLASLPGWQGFAVVASPTVVAISCALLFYALNLAQSRQMVLVIGVALGLLALPSLSWPLPNGVADVAVLDVGQGLAVVVRTRHHCLLYDTGGGGAMQLDMGRHVVLPYLAAEGMEHLDKVVISHQDMDHRGGLVSVRRGIAIGELIDNRQGAGYCHTHPGWQWDGIGFRFLSFPSAGNENQRSCVLLVSNRHQQLLLTGDIDQRTEASLVQRWGKALHATTLVVPHHGSASSSSTQFIQAVAPRYAIISAGFANRYRLPKAEVVARYRSQGSVIYNTATCGRAHWILRDREQTTDVSCYRWFRGWA